ncbi:MAG: MarR family winged helix-turn-helix transcriptional regulator [Anaerolineae bacterium]
MGTKYQGTADEIRALNLFIKLTRASHSVATYINGLIASYGLTESQFGTLEALYHLGPMCQGDIAAKVLRSSGNMTTVIDNLLRDGFVSKRRDPNDRRQVIVSLTDKGRALIDEVFPHHVGAIVERLNVLTPEEQDTLADLCKKLGTTQEEPPDELDD